LNSWSKKKENIGKSTKNSEESVAYRKAVKLKRTVKRAGRKENC
jgi:hypothetical protein